MTEVLESREPSMHYGARTRLTTSAMALHGIALDPAASPLWETSSSQQRYVSLLAALVAFAHRIGVHKHRRRRGDGRHVVASRLASNADWHAVPVDVEMDDTLDSLCQRLTTSSPQAPRVEGFSGVFDVALVVHPGGEPCIVEALEVAPLVLHLEEASLDLRLAFHLDGLTPEQCAQAAGHLSRMLSATLTEPQGKVGDVDLLSDQEKLWQTVTLNETARPELFDTSLVELLEHAARQFPTHTAVRCEEQCISYASLHARANALASRLQQVGVGKNSIVGLCLHRSIDMIVALLGIMKAGAAHLPLDPSFPLDRLAYMAENAQVQVIVSHPAAESAARQVASSAVHVMVDEAVQEEGPPRDNGLDDLSYVLYTSGSTGRPKGVPIAQRALVNYLQCMQAELRFSSQDTWLALITISFDMAYLEIYLTLMSGALLVIGTKELALDGKALARAIEVESPTWTQGTPTFWRLLLESGWAGSPTLNMVTGGELFPRALADALLAKSKAVYNYYGPTETGNGSIIWQVQPGPGVAIGRPVANTTVYLFDERQRLVPAGLPGELCMGGVGLSPGYLNRPELTHEKFIYPFPQEPSKRLYRTGDLARYWPDGNLEILGRVDDQIKLNGYRIEPGEIEAQLSQHRAVRHAVVVAKHLGTVDARLVAYWCPQERVPPTVRELREHLLAHVPPYMVPSRFVRVERFPLTPNGKVDRRTLHSMDEGTIASELEASYVAPQTDLQKHLATMWEDILGVEPVGIHHNFFELGGTSLLAVELIRKIATFFQVELSALSVYSATTIERFEAVVRSAPSVRPESRTETRPEKDLFSNFPLSCGQEMIWYITRSAGNVGRIINTTIADRLVGPLNVDALERSVSALAERHPLLRAIFASPDGIPVQTVSDSVGIALHHVDLQGLSAAAQEDRVHEMLKAEDHFEFDLATGPLYRPTLVKLDSERHVLIQAISHIVSDAFSVIILRRDLGLVYSAFVLDRALSLPPMPVSAPDYIRERKAALAGQVHPHFVSAWHRYLACPLPADHPRDPQAPYSNYCLTLPVKDELVKAAERFSLERHCTSHVTYLAALSATLYQLLRQDVVTLHTLAGNRDASTALNLVGAFVTSLVFAVDCTAAMSYEDLFTQVRDIYLEVLPHAEYSFADLRSAMLKVAPITTQSQTSFVFNHLPPFSQLELAGLQSEALTSLRMSRGESEEPVALERKTNIDLMFRLTPDRGRMLLELAYNANLYDTSTIRGLAERYTANLEACIVEPDRRVLSPASDLATDGIFSA